MTFAALATISCSTKRATIVGGKRSAPTTNLTGLLCTPLDPVDPELRRRMQLETPYEILQTFITGDPDIVEGDVLVVGSSEYPIRAVGDWTWRSTVYRHLFLEDLKT